MEHQAAAKFEFGSARIARALNERLTEAGLKRIIAKNSSYGRRHINRLQLDTLGRNIGFPRSRLAKSIKKTKRGIKSGRASMPTQNYGSAILVLSARARVRARRVPDGLISSQSRGWVCRR